MVSAPVVAREYDIDVSETKRETCEDYHTLVRLTVTTERQTRSIAGSLFAGTKPRIVEVEGISLEAEVARNMLFVRNEDKPGFHRPAGHGAGRRRHQHRQLQPRPPARGRQRPGPGLGRQPGARRDRQGRAGPAQRGPGQGAELLSRTS